MRPTSNNVQVPKRELSSSIEVQSELLGQAIDSNDFAEVERLLEGTISKDEKVLELALARSLDRRSMPCFRILLAKMPLPASEMPNSPAMKIAIRHANLEAALKLWESKRQCEPSQLVQLLEDGRLVFDYNKTGDLIRLIGLVQNEMDDERRLKFLKNIASANAFQQSFQEWLNWSSTQSMDIQRKLTSIVVDKFISGGFPSSNITIPFSDFRQADDSAKLRLLSCLCFSEERRQRISGNINDLGLENVDFSGMFEDGRIRLWPELDKIVFKLRTNSLSSWIRDVKLLVERKGNTADFSKIWDGNCAQFLDSPLTGDDEANTSLTLALENNRFDFVQWLFQQGANRYSKNIRSDIAQVFLYIERDVLVPEAILAKWSQGMGVWTLHNNLVVPYEPLVHAVHKGSSKKLRRLISALELNQSSSIAYIDNAFATASRLNLPEMEQVIVSCSSWNLERNVKVFREHFEAYCQILQTNSSLQKEWIRNLPHFLGEFMSPPEPNHLSNAFELHWKIIEGVKKGRIDQEIDFIQSYDLYSKKMSGITLPSVSDAKSLNHIEVFFYDAMSKAMRDPNMLELSLIEGMPLTDNLIRKIVNEMNTKALRVILKNASLRKKHAIAIQDCFEESSMKENNELVELFLSFGLHYSK